MKLVSNRVAWLSYVLDEDGKDVQAVLTGSQAEFYITPALSCMEHRNILFHRKQVVVNLCNEIKRK